MPRFNPMIKQRLYAFLEGSSVWFRLVGCTRKHAKYVPLFLVLAAVITVSVYLFVVVETLAAAKLIGVNVGALVALIYTSNKHVLNGTGNSWRNQGHFCKEWDQS